MVVTKLALLSSYSSDVRKGIGGIKTEVARFAWKHTKTGRETERQAPSKETLAVGFAFAQTKPI